MLSKKYYKKFAQILKINDVEAIRHEFILMCMDDNPSFDEKRFRKAMSD